MKENITFTLLPRQDGRSKYDWLNIDCGGTRVGKVRGLIKGETLTIHSINIFPEFAGRGFGRRTIDMFKQSFNTIIADRVRYKAIGFWEKLGFVADGSGGYVWRKKQRGLR